MSRRQCVLDALNHRNSERVAWAIDLTSQANDNLVRYTGDLQIAEKISGDILAAPCTGAERQPVPGKPGYFEDEFGVVWNCNGADKDIGVVDKYLIEDIEDYDYQFPEPDETKIRNVMEGMLKNRGDKFTVASFGFSMFERSWTLMGMEDVLVAMITNPEELEELYDKICDYYMRLLDIALEYDVDAIRFGDDWGQQRGLIMGPDHWRRFIKPRMARMYARVKASGKYIIQHSCGDCREIFPDLIEIGLDCYNTFQPEIYDIKEMKRLYGDKITFYGAISTQQVLPYMKPDELQKEIVRIMNILKDNGGLIISPTHAVPFDVPAENILAMAEVFENQKRFLG